MVIKNIVRGHVITIEFEGVEELCDEILPIAENFEAIDYLDINVAIYKIDETHASYFVDGEEIPLIKYSPADKYWHFDDSKM